MKRLEKVALSTCAFTVLISLLFFLVAKIGKPTEAISIGFSQYLIIFAFGLLISLSNMLFELKSWHIVLRVALHFAVLLGAFLIIFSRGAISLDSVADFFIAIFVFAILYAIFFALSILFKKAIGKLDAKLDTQKKPRKSDEKKGDDYKPRFR